MIDAVGMSSKGRDFVMRKPIKAFTDTIVLGLIVDTDTTREKQIDFVRKKEVLSWS